MTLLYFVSKLVFALVFLFFSRLSSKKINCELFNFTVKKMTKFIFVDLRHLKVFNIALKELTENYSEEL